MEKFVIEGGAPLNGEVTPQGTKMLRFHFWPPVCLQTNQSY